MGNGCASGSGSGKGRAGKGSCMGVGRGEEQSMAWARGRANALVRLLRSDSLGVFWNVFFFLFSATIEFQDIEKIAYI